MIYRGYGGPIYTRNDWEWILFLSISTSMFAVVGMNMIFSRPITGYAFCRCLLFMINSYIVTWRWIRDGGNSL